MTGHLPVAMPGGKAARPSSADRPPGCRQIARLPIGRSAIKLVLAAVTGTWSHATSAMSHRPERASSIRSPRPLPPLPLRRPALAESPACFLEVLGGDAAELFLDRDLETGLGVAIPGGVDGAPRSADRQRRLRGQPAGELLRRAFQVAVGHHPVGQPYPQCLGGAADLEIG